MFLTFDKNKKLISCASWVPNSHDSNEYVSMELDGEFDGSYEWTYTQKTVDGEIIYTPSKGDLIPVDKDEEKRKSNETALALMREKRDKLLSETDWWASSDLSGMSQERKDYRQKLRDLPETASPKLTDGELSGVTWPDKPKEGE